MERQLAGAGCAWAAGRHPGLAAYLAMQVLALHDIAPGPCFAIQRGSVAALQAFKRNLLNSLQADEEVIPCCTRSHVVP